MNFPEFIQNVSEQSPEYWQTHTFSIGDKGNIITQNKAPSENKEEIVRIFQEGMQTFKEDLKKGPLRLSLFTLATKLPTDVKTKCFELFQSFAIDEVTAADHTKVPITVCDLHRSPRLQDHLTKPKNEPLLACCSEEEMRAYHSYCENPSENISLEEAFKVLIVARWLQDRETVHSIIYETIPSLMENLSESKFYSIASKFYPDTYTYSRLTEEGKTFGTIFSNFIDHYCHEDQEFWKTHTLFLAGEEVVVGNGSLQNEKRALDILKKGIEGTLLEFKKGGILSSNFFTLLNHLPQKVKEDLLNVPVIEEQISGQSVTLSLNDLRRSTPLQMTVQKKFRQTVDDSLVASLSKEEWETYFSFANSNQQTPLSFEQVKQILKVADFLQDHETIQRIVQKNLGFQELSDNEFIEEIGQLLEYFQSSSIPNLQEYIAKLIRGRIKGKNQAYILSFFEKLSTSLNRKETISSVDLTHLNLSECNISNALLLSISKRFPEIRVLDISSSYQATSKNLLEELRIPEQWQPNIERLIASGCRGLKSIRDSEKLHNLRFLNISGSNFKQAPSGLTNLEEFVAAETDLEDLSGLDHLKHLKYIDLIITTVQRAPIGCINLEVFRAYNNRSLRDISGLNNCKKLRILHLINPHIGFSVFPSNCKNLVEVSIHDAPNLEDCSGLDDSLKLKTLELISTKVKKVPKGCKHLMIFSSYTDRYTSGSLIEDLSGLDDLGELISVNLSNSLVSRAPLRCKKLRFFIAHSCKNLEDISGLNNLLYLEEVQISGSKAIAAPKGCINIQTFAANYARSFEDLSPLDDSPKLRTIFVANTSVKNYVRRCPNLILFSGINAYGLSASTTCLMEESPLLQNLNTPYIEMKKK